MVSVFKTQDDVIFLCGRYKILKTAQDIVQAKRFFLFTFPQLFVNEILHLRGIDLPFPEKSVQPFALSIHFNPAAIQNSFLRPD